MTSTATDNVPNRGDTPEPASSGPPSLNDSSPTSLTSLRSDDNDNDDERPRPSSDDDSSSHPDVSTRSDAGPTDIRVGRADAPDLQAAALDFLANASPPTLIGLSVAGFAVIYAILGRLGLVLIGALLGFLANTYWEGKYPSWLAGADHREQGTETLGRLWSDLKRAGDADGTHPLLDGTDEAGQPAVQSFDDFQPETREALGGLVDAIIHNYVKWWYNPVVPSDHSFPLVCRKVLISYIISISNRMARKRPADALLDLLTNSSSMIIVLFSELSNAFSELPPDSNFTATDTIYHYLAENPESRLTDLLNQRQQNAKLKMVAEDLLGFLDKNSFNCDPVRTFLREILANVVLEQTLQQCSRAEFINRWIVHLLEAGEPNINQAIDVGMQSGRDMANNEFADLDGNVGNVGIAKARRGSPDQGVRRKQEPAHKKKLSRAEEELAEAMEDMKRMNAMIAEDNARRERAATISGSSESPKQSLDLTTRTSRTQSVTPGDAPSSSILGSFLPRASSSTDLSPRSDTIMTPGTPESTNGSSNQEAAPPPSPPSQQQQQQQQQPSADEQFTSFDQIVPPSKAEAEEECPKKAELTLHNATFTLHDDSAGDTAKIKSKPNTDYLIQVEPSSSAWPGWMIVRRYSDFETLHEILRRIAAVSASGSFAELHHDLPSWKLHTRESLRGELERYLRDACWNQALAESEGMKRFLEKSQGHTHTNNKTFAWDSVGKNMLDVLSGAPKGAMEGGKNLVGGVTGVFAGLGRKSVLLGTSQSADATPSTSRLSLTASLRENFTRSPTKSDRASLDSQRSSVVSIQPGKVAPMERRPSFQSQNGEGEGEGEGEGARAVDGVDKPGSSAPASARASTDRGHSRPPSLASLDLTKLPPPPNEMSDDYGSPTAEFRARTAEGPSPAPAPAPTSAPAAATKLIKKEPPTTTTTKPNKQFSRLTESETRVAVELIFALINEMYTLSSAWNFRRTLLTAAKSFLLRPGNPSLLTVQSLIQSTVLDANTSDRGIATQLRMLRANVMPTKEERANWPTGMTAQEKEKLAVRARQLLIQSGVPAALTGVMGQAATGEALGRVFDCLQIEEVARGLVFGLILQFVRIITH